MIKMLTQSIKNRSITKKLIKFFKKAFDAAHASPAEHECFKTIEDAYVQEFKMSIAPIIEQAKNLVTQYNNGTLSTIPIISVAGCSGVGKTHFASLLHQILSDEGLNVLLLQQDNFLQYDGKFEEPITDINPFLKWKDIHTVMLAIKDGVSEITIPQLNRAILPYTIESKTVDLSGTQIILFEGTYSLGDTDSYNFFKFSNLGIFMDTSPANSSQWVKERELARQPHLQRTQEKLERDIFAELERYHKFVISSKKNASFIVYKEKKNKYSLFILHKPLTND